MRQPRTAAPRQSPFIAELEVPLPRRGLTRGLFGLIQVMYLIFYVIALFRLGEIERITSLFCRDGDRAPSSWPCW